MTSKLVSQRQKEVSQARVETEAVCKGAKARGSVAILESATSSFSLEVIMG